MFKKDFLLQPWQIAVRIQFNFETVWCIREGNSLLLESGDLLPITYVYALGKALVGRDDPYQIGLDYSEYSRAFRAALDQRNIEQSKSQFPPKST